MQHPVFLILAILVGHAVATPVDNGVEGEPEIECGATAITISFNTRNPFEGHVYHKGLYAQAGCRTDGTGQQRTGSISTQFDQCNVRRTRSLSPKGIFVVATVIISFHPKFETKVDRAYKVQCFYMEADKTVTTELEVSMLTTRFQTQQVPMPICRYQLFSGGPNGQLVKYAIVGQPVYHKWTCDTETVNTFCMRVYGCFVDDGKGDKVDLLDEKGCAIDKYLLNNLEYPTDLMAGKEAHVFKYADRAQLYFQCQIEITIKEPNAACVRPTCPEPAKGRKRRSSALNRRQAFRPTADAAGTMDVTAELAAMDVEDKNGSLNQHDGRLLSGLSTSPVIGSNSQGDICLSSVGFGIFIAFVVVMLVSTCITVGLFFLKRSSK